MLLALTEKQESILDFVRKFKASKYRKPTYTELSKEFSIQRSALHKQIKAIEAKGHTV